MANNPIVIFSHYAGHLTLYQYVFGYWLAQERKFLYFYCHNFEWTGWVNTMQLSHGAMIYDSHENFCQTKEEKQNRIKSLEIEKTNK